MITTLPEIVGTVRTLLKEGEECYLVGGAVRDLLLQHTAHDFDFCTSGDPRRLARRVAERTGGAFYVMDEERLTSRVLVDTLQFPQLVLDFAALQGTLEEDLKGRDFTVNAMALDLRHPEEMVDPLKGARDLQEKWLRPCRQDSFSADPVRVIRALRYAAGLHLRIEPVTCHLLTTAGPLLEDVSLERKRDELFKLLDLEVSFVAVSLMQELHILNRLGLSLQPQRLAQYRTCELFAALLCSSAGKVRQDFFTAATFSSAMTQLRPELVRYLSERNSGGRTRLQLSKYFLLMPATKAAMHLPGELTGIFARQELDFLHNCLENEDSATAFVTSEPELTRREIYRFFNRVGDEGVGLILLALACFAGRPAAEIAQADWVRVLHRSTELLQMWFLHPEVCRPKPLLNGEQIMAACELEPGPLVGQLLDALKEEQAAGEITSTENALAWLTQRCHQARES